MTLNRIAEGERGSIIDADKSHTTSHRNEDMTWLGGMELNEDMADRQP